MNYFVIGFYLWIFVFVGFVLIIVFVFNVLGDGLCDVIDFY